MRNHTYQLEVERTSGGDLKINSATQLVKANQHTSRYERPLSMRRVRFERLRPLRAVSVLNHAPSA